MKAIYLVCFLLVHFVVLTPRSDAVTYYVSNESVPAVIVRPGPKVPRRPGSKVPTNTELFRLGLLCEKGLQRANRFLHRPGMGGESLINDMHKFRREERRALGRKKISYFDECGMEAECNIMSGNSFASSVRQNMSTSLFLTTCEDIGYGGIVHIAKDPRRVYGYGRPGCSIYSVAMDDRPGEYCSFDDDLVEAFQLSILNTMAYITDVDDFNTATDFIKYPTNQNNRVWIVTLDQLFQKGIIRFYQYFSPRIPPMPLPMYPVVHQAASLVDTTASPEKLLEELDQLDTTLNVDFEDDSVSSIE